MCTVAGDVSVHPWEFSERSSLCIIIAKIPLRDISTMFVMIMMIRDLTDKLYVVKSV